MTIYPAAPEWELVRPPSLRKLSSDDYEYATENARRIGVLVDWLDRCQHAEHEQGDAADLSDVDFERAAMEDSASKLRLEERKILQEIFRRKASKESKKGKARNENGWEALAALLRKAPSPRLILVVADLIEFGAFTNAADLSPSMKMRAIEAAEWRAWILERLRAAYTGISDQLLLERASDATLAFTDFRATDSIQHFNLDVADKGRMRLASLIHSVRNNRW